MNFLKIRNMEHWLIGDASDVLDQETRRSGAWWLSGRFGALRPEGRKFETNSSRNVGTLGKYFNRSCL